MKLINNLRLNMSLHTHHWHDVDDSARKIKPSEPHCALHPFEVTGTVRKLVIRVCYTQECCKCKITREDIREITNIEKAMRYPTLGDEEVIGNCENCSGPVFDSKNQPYDDVVICKECIDAG